MGGTSFKLDNTLNSFKLDKTISYYIHLSKDLIRRILFKYLGIGESIFHSISEKISQSDFIEPQDLFESIINFFSSIYKDVSIGVYQYQPFDNSLMLFVGDSHSHQRKIFLNDFGEKEYINERGSIQSKELMCELRGYGLGAKISININGYILCFYMRQRYFEKNVRKIKSIFNFGFADHVRAKLMLLESKYQDPRTQLYNSKYINEVVSKKPNSIIKIDINDFKLVNDTYGHAAGDIVLEELGLILKSSIGVNDKACRDGGDEFSIFIDSNESFVIEKVISRINNNLDNLNEKRVFPILISIGYCIEDGKKTFVEKMNFADEKMYKQKNENSQIYRLSKKIISIKDPEIYNQLLTHIINNTTCSNSLHEAYELLTKKRQFIEIPIDGD